MKKVATIFLVLSFLSTVTGCDFIRSVAGRPTGEDLEQLSKVIQKHKKDSLAKVEIAAQKQKEEELRIADSLARVQISEEFNIKFSEIFHFGEPSSQQMKKFNVVIGVYRYLATFAGQVEKVTSCGFSPFDITFPEGEHALCLGAADNLDELRDLILRGRSSGVCPKDAWIYVNNKE